MRTKRIRQQFLKGLVQIPIITLVIGLMLTMPSLAGQNNVVINIGQEGITATGAPQITYMLLRVADPSGRIVYEEDSKGTPLAWSIPAGSPDGLYSYEVRLGVAPKKEKRDPSLSHEPKGRAMVESGSFRVENGSIVPPTEEETGMLDSVRALGSYALNSILDFLVAPAAADQVIADDLIVQMSECVGFDCVNNENFGFDTIRLKENNLRIKFQDTSTGTFPTVDWQIIINDTTNGGASYFGVQDVDSGRIPFRVDAGAPNNALYVKSTGRIGIGTSTPVVDVHVVEGNTPTLRLDQDGSAGWTAQVWDVGANEANFFVRDVTNGSRLPFRIKPGAQENTLTLTSGGRVGINTWSPTQSLHVNGDALINGTIVQGSSRELKDNIESLAPAEALATVAMLRPVKFQYKAAPEEEVIGFVAEEVPDLVATNDRKGVSSMDVVALLTKVVQEQQKAIDELRSTIVRLEATLEERKGGQSVSVAR